MGYENESFVYESFLDSYDLTVPEFSEEVQLSYRLTNLPNRNFNRAMTINTRKEFNQLIELYGSSMNIVYKLNAAFTDNRHQLFKNFDNMGNIIYNRPDIGETSIHLIVCYPSSYLNNGYPILHLLVEEDPVNDKLFNYMSSVDLENFYRYNKSLMSELFKESDLYTRTQINVDI